MLMFIEYLQVHFNLIYKLKNHFIFKLKSPLKFICKTLNF